ncbi:MAG TPA: terminase family protein [Armatimonadota bacterium]|nr:terminase family protein [Armatimonadota bacterium]
MRTTARYQPCPKCGIPCGIEPGENTCPACGYKWMAIMPQEGPQTVFLGLASVDIIVYGGAAGSGKTWALLLDPVRDFEDPDFRGTLFRRKSVELTLAGGLWDESHKIYPHLTGKATASPTHRWVFPGGASLAMTHLNMEDDKYSHQGAQNAWQGWDELTHFSEAQFWYLQSRGRSVSGVHVRTRATTNPDGGSWVKKMLAPWVDDTYPDKANRNGEVRWLVRIEESEGQDAQYHYFRRREDAVAFAKEAHHLSDEDAEYAIKSVAFVEAELADNVILKRTNPGYLANLLTLPKVERQRLLYRDWNVLTDTFFDEWKPNLEDGRPWHVIPADAVPRGCNYYIGSDWGFKDPCAHYLIAVLSGGRKIVCREVYASRVKTREQGDAIIRMMQQTGWTDGPGKAIGLKLDQATVCAGFDVFARRLRSDGSYDEPIVQTWWDMGLNVVSAGRDPLNRADNMRSHLADWGPDEGWEDGRPGLQVMDCCPNLIRTIGLLKSDPNNSEVVNTTLEDHAFDAVGHVLTSAPATPQPPRKERSRPDRALEEEIEELERQEREEVRGPEVYVM